MSTQKPTNHPISMLPVFTEMIDGMHESSQEQLVYMEQAKHKSHVLDDFTINRLKEVYTNQLADQWLFVEQFDRWQAMKLTDAQRNEVSRLSLQVAQLKTVNEGILKIVSAIEHATIDKIMAMEDGELALAVMSGKIKLPT